MRPANKIWVTTVIAAMATLLGVGVSAAPGDTIRVSVSNDGTQGNNHSYGLSVSEDGRYVVFHSQASNLIPDDDNGVWDVFVHDTETIRTVRVGVVGDDPGINSGDPSISADGRFVAYPSDASNSVPGDTNERRDVFLYDTETAETWTVSVASDATEGNNDSFAPWISADGHYVAFESYASNLVPNDSNETGDVFVHDRDASETTRVSVASDGSEGNGWSTEPSLSADGRYVAFSSDASNLVPSDTNGETDVFVHDMGTSETRRVSVGSDGTQANLYSYAPSISADGRYVAFSSVASNLVPGDSNHWPDVFIHDTETAETMRMSVASDGTEGNDRSGWASVSGDGRFVAFYSSASNLVDGDTNESFDVFVHDTVTTETMWVSVATDGSEGNEDSYQPAVTGDGRFVAFGSDASNLVAGDTNGYGDVFMNHVPINYFTDDGHLFEDDINAIAEAGITRGCNPPENDHYCPDESFLRGQAAAFLRRALNVPASDTDHFGDDDNSVFEGDIDAIATEGITLGCNPPDNTMFCPDDPFTRGQAAAFVRRALEVPASDVDHFVDDDNSVFEGDIDAIAEAGITRGCNPPENDRYCPNELLTRGQAGAFMRRALLP